VGKLFCLQPPDHQNFLFFPEFLEHLFSQWHAISDFVSEKPYLFVLEIGKHCSKTIHEICID
jgi:hypothetical protein